MSEREREKIRERERERERERTRATERQSEKENGSLYMEGDVVTLELPPSANTGPTYVTTAGA